MKCKRCGELLHWGRHPNGALTRSHWRDPLGNPTCVILDADGNEEMRVHEYDLAPELTNVEAVVRWLDEA